MKSNNVDPACPAECEGISSNIQLGKRLLVSAVHAARLRASELRPVREGLARIYYKTADLDRIRERSLSAIRAKFALCSGGERERLAKVFSEVSAFQAGREEPSQADFTAAREAVKLDALEVQLEKLGAEISAVSSRLSGYPCGKISMQAERPRYCLRATRVDSRTGVIVGATVAQAGVNAIGKFVLLDSKGQITRNESAAVRKVPCFTDDQTLQTLLTAAAAAGGKVKVRSDHSDTVEARAGFADNFRQDGDRIVADVHLFDSYRDRAVVLECATKTPEQIGLSVDMIPSFEIVGDKAFMRIKNLDAVDIVDAGAVTPNGLL
jgi:hypothetical protein